MWPNQLHIQDINVFNQYALLWVFTNCCLHPKSRIFKVGSKFDKDGKFYSNPAIAGAFFEDSRLKTALPCRNMLAPGFTREAVRRSESRITYCLEKFLGKLSEYAQTGGPVDLTTGFMCLAADTTMNFIFQKPYGALDADNFQSELLVPVIDFSRMQQWPFYFPRLFGAVFKVTDILPTWMLKRWLKGILTQQGCLEVRRFNCLIKRIFWMG